MKFSRIWVLLIALAFTACDKGSVSEFSDSGGWGYCDPREVSEVSELNKDMEKNYDINLDGSNLESDVKASEMYDAEHASRHGAYGQFGAIGQDSLVIDRVFFAYNSDNLTAFATKTLDKQAEWLRENPSVKVIIKGHCDERGTRAYNLALGERRASVAKDYLVALGIEPDRITVTSLGKEEVLVPGSNEEAWAQNRTSISVPQN